MSGKVFILLTRLVSEGARPAVSVEDKARVVNDKVREYCPAVVWLANYAILGPWDYVDIFAADDTETAMKVAALVRFYGGAQTEIWPAMEWGGFKRDVLHSFSGMDMSRQ